MIEYEDTIDQYLVNAIDILYIPAQATTVKEILVNLFHYEEYDALEEVLQGMITINDSDDSTTADSVLSTIITFAIEYLHTIGLLLNTNDPVTILNTLITFKELQQLTRETALELSVLISDDELGSEYIMGTIIEYYTNTTALSMYEDISYIKPSVMKDLKSLIDNTIENIYTEETIVDNYLASSYIYKNFIQDPNTLVDYHMLLEELIKYINLTDDITLIAHEVSIVVNYSADVENKLYFLQTVVTEDLIETYLDTDKASAIDAIISTATKLIKG